MDTQAAPETGRGEQGPYIPRPRRIVVGVDGSDGSLAALSFALDEARDHRATVEAVWAWHHPRSYGWAATLDDWDPVTDADRILADALKAVTAGGPPPVKVSLRVAEGQPADVLVRVAAGADLLVVGSRGHGGFAGLLLGSVSQQCTHHAPCPVVVVPPLAGTDR